MDIDSAKQASKIIRTFALKKQFMAHIVDLGKYTDRQQQLARIAKAMGHPARIAILELLEKQSHCYHGDLTADLPIAASSVSQHLNELKDAGLIQGEFNPPKVKYCINRERWQEAQRLFGAFFQDLPGENEEASCCE